MKSFPKLALKPGLLAAALALGLSAQAEAAPITFDLQWSGAPFGNAATAAGSITLDDSLNDGSFHNVSLPSALVSALSLTVSGASSGNGNFGLGDFFAIRFIASAVLDLSQDLVGQAGFSDFNVFAATPGAPTGVAPFTLQANLGSPGGDQLLLTSMAPQVAAAVPEIDALFGTAALGLLGFALALAGERRRRAA